MPELRKLPVLTIAEPEHAMRFNMDTAMLAELATSMRELGLLQPLVVKAKGDGTHEIVAGHRRYLAARQLGWLEIECKVYAVGELDDAAAMLAENIYREDITAAEEAEWLSELMRLRGVDTIGLAQVVHKSQDYVEDRLRLFQGDEQVFKALRERKINFSVARELNKFQDEGQRRYHLDAATRSTPPARVVAQWRANAELTPPPPVSEGQQSVAQQTPAAGESEPEGCFLCGGNRDTYNLAYVRIHHQCKADIERRLAEMARE